MNVDGGKLPPHTPIRDDGFPIGTTDEMIRLEAELIGFSEQRYRDAVFDEYKSGIIWMKKIDFAMLMWIKFLEQLGDSVKALPEYFG